MMLKTRLLRGIMLTVALASLATMLCVARVQYRTLDRALTDVEQRIHGSLALKGSLLSESHSVALRGLVEDNALADVRGLVERTVRDDPEVVYGLFVAPNLRTWAYASDGDSPSEDVPPPNAHTMLGFGEDVLVDRPQHSERERLDMPVMEFAAPVVVDGENLGTLRYGLSKQGIVAAVAAERERSRQALVESLLWILAISIASSLGAFVVARRLAHKIVQPLVELTRAAKKIEGGDRTTRALVSSGDELQLLAEAFNGMIEAREQAFASLEETTERALESSRLKGEFLANMSHEIRTPMNGVIGVTKLLLRHPLDAKLRRYIETIDASGAALMTIINDVLDFSKMEAGSYTLQDVPFDLRIVTQEVAELLGVRAQEQGVDLICRVDPELRGAVVGDPDRFRQILHNLVGNAIKFTERGEVFVNITGQTLDGDALLIRAEVHDTGIGIEAKDLDTLFDAFTQVDGSLRRRHGGTGLGLAISRRLAQLMRGDIQVQSTPGQGSCFTATVRLRHDPQPLQNPSTPSVRGKRVLVIEGSERCCSVIEEHMRIWGVHCTTVKAGVEALGLLQLTEIQQERFDAIIVGAHRGEPSTPELIRAVRVHSQAAEVPLVLLGPAGQSTSLTEVELDVAAQLTKPLRLSDLYNSLVDIFLGRPPKREFDMTVDAGRLRSHRPILVVDDNAINRFVAVQQLAFLGYRAEVAADGRHAVDRVRDGTYLAVLMDCQMPVLDGYAATREIRALEERERRKRLPIIALTAHAMVSERERVLQAGMDDYISKPLSGATLEKTLLRHLPADLPDAPSPDDVVTTTASGEPASQEASSPSSVPPAHALDPAQGLHGELTNTVLPQEARVATANDQGQSSSHVANASGAVPPIDPSVPRSGRLVQLFLKHGPAQVADLHAAIAAQNIAEVRESAHRLKGTCLSIAADPMAELAEALQLQAETGNLGDAAALLAQIDGAMAQVVAALSEELRGTVGRAS